LALAELQAVDRFGDETSRLSVPPKPGKRTCRSAAEFANAAAFATLALFIGCSDAVAPVVTKVKEIAARVDNLLTCTNTWATANSGLWSTAGMWSAGHVPTATDRRVHHAGRQLHP